MVQIISAYLALSGVVLEIPTAYLSCIYLLHIRVMAWTRSLEEMHHCFRAQIYLMLDKTSVLSFGVALPVIDEQRSEITQYTKQLTLLLVDI